MGNSESRNKLSEQKEAPEIKPNQNQWLNAVNGNTEQLQVSSPKPNINHAAFETTSENANFTVSEELKPMPINETMVGGFNLSSIFNKLSSMLQDTEMDGGLSNDEFVNNKLSHIKSLLEDTEVESQLGGHLERIRELLQETETNNLVGGFNEVNPMLNKLRHLLLQETESNVINFKGGALNNENLFSENSLTESEKPDQMGELKKEEKEEHYKEKEEEENANTDQSGGEELDTELKNILVELQTNNKNVNKHTGGKSSRKGSKKSGSKKSGSKRQSRRTASSEPSNQSENTYNVGDSDESDGEEYLSTSSMNTSDINIKHYRS